MVGIVFPLTSRAIGSTRTCAVRKTGPSNPTLRRRAHPSLHLRGTFGRSSRSVGIALCFAMALTTPNVEGNRPADGMRTEDQSMCRRVRLTVRLGARIYATRRNSSRISLRNVRSSPCCWMWLFSASLMRL